MSPDIEELVAELGPGYADFVAALREKGGDARCQDGFTERVMAAIALSERRARAWRFAWLGAAAAAAVAAIGIFMPSAAPSVDSDLAALVAAQRADGTFSDSSAAVYAQAYAVQALAVSGAASLRPALERAVAALERTQGADGGWSNPRLSAENAAALSAAVAAGVESARIALRRALRYLHANGIPEASSERLAAVAKRAVAGLSGAGDFAAAVASGV